MPIYMTYEGIPGDVTAEGFADHIEVNSFSLGVNRGIKSDVGGSKDREATAPRVSEITFTKPMDKTSFKFLEAALHGEGKPVVIKFVKTDATKLETYATYTLTKTMVSSYAVNSDGDRPGETIKLSFTKIEYAFVQMAEGNEGADNPRISYDLSTAVVA